MIKEFTTSTSTTRQANMYQSSPRRSYIVDQQLLEVPVGATGQLCLAGTKVARGYDDQPARTAERFLPDPFSQVPGGRLFVTDGAARRLADGRWDYAGRINPQITVLGRQVAQAPLAAVAA